MTYLSSQGLVLPRRFTPEELNKILLHAVPNVWTKQAYLQGWDFEMKSYKATCELFERMEIAEKSTKVEKIVKLQLRQIPTVPVMVEKERDENPPSLPTPRRVALENERKETQAIRAIGRPEEKYSCCTAPGTICNSAK